MRSLFFPLGQQSLSSCVHFGNPTLRNLRRPPPKTVSEERKGECSTIHFVDYDKVVNISLGACATVWLGGASTTTAVPSSSST